MERTTQVELPVQAGLKDRTIERLRNVKVWHLYLFLLPTFIFLIVFQYYPAFSAIYHAFTRWNGAGISRWVGLRNFEDMLADRLLMQSLENMLYLGVWGIVRSVIFPLMAAEMIFNLRSQRSQYWFRLLLVVPIVVPFIVNVLVWRFIMAPKPLGVLNAFLGLVGLDVLTRPWLADPRTALPSLMFVGFPWVGAIGMLILYAGLINIPEALVDATKIDGASAWRRIFSLDLPLILGQIKLIFILSVINTIQEFGGILVMTNGGPGYSTLVPALHMYKVAFQGDRFGYAAAIGLVMFVFILILTYINMTYLKSSVEYEA